MPEQWQYNKITGAQAPEGETKMNKQDIIKKIQEHKFFVPKIKTQSKEYLQETLKKLEERKTMKKDIKEINKKITKEQTEIMELLKQIEETLIDCGNKNNHWGHVGDTVRLKEDLKNIIAYRK